MRQFDVVILCEAGSAVWDDGEALFDQFTGCKYYHMCFVQSFERSTVPNVGGAIHGAAARALLVVTCLMSFIT